MTRDAEQEGTGPERLERALEAFLARASDRDELLAGDPELRDLVTPMLDETISDAPSARRLGEFKVLREIGRGGMGVVYEAEQTSLGRRVALKVLMASTLDANAAAIARFRREGAAAAALEHPGIVKIHALGAQKGAQEGAQEGAQQNEHWIAMELITGGSLYDRADEIRSRGIPACVTLVATVADALEYAHTRGLVHRDVKPENILLREDGTPVLTDFGLVRQSALPSVSQTGAFVGTPYYASPEQIAAKGVDGRSDVFSLGVTLYELVAGKRPFVGANTPDVLRSIRADQPKRPDFAGTALPLDLWAIVGKAIEKDPRARYQSASELASDLRAFLAFLPIRARAPSVPRRVARWIRRSPLQAAFGASVAASLAVCAYVLAKASDIRAGERAQLEAEIERAMVASSEQLLLANPQGALAACDRALELDPGCEEALIERFVAPWIVRDERDPATRANDQLVQLVGYQPRFWALPSFARLAVELEAISKGRAPSPPRSGTRDVFELVVAGFFAGEVARTKAELERAHSLLHRALLASEKPRFTLAVKYSRVVIAFGDKRLADDTATILQTHWPERLDALLLSGTLYVTIEPEKAVEILRRVLAREPDNLVALLDCANALGRLLRHREAQELKERSVKVAPRNADYWENVGIGRLQLDELPGAEAAGQRALELEPNRNSARILIAQAKIKAGDLATAESILADALQRAPDSPKALSAYGHVLERQKRYAEAEPVLVKAAAKSPADPFPRVLLGAIYTRRGDLAAAQKSYEEILARQPDHHDATLNLALVLDKLEDGAGAVRLARKALGFEELEGSSIQRLLRILHERSDLEAIRDYEARLARSNKSQVETSNLAVILHRLGDAKGAVRVARRGLGYDKMPSGSVDMLLRLLQQHGDFAGIREHHEHRLARTPRDPADLLAAARFVVTDPEANPTRDLVSARAWVDEASRLDPEQRDKALGADTDLLVWGQRWNEALAKIAELKALQPSQAESKRLDSLALRCKRALRDAARAASSRPQSAPETAATRQEGR